MPGNSRPSTEHVMLYSDVRDQVRENAHSLAIMSLRMATLTGEATIGDMSLTVVIADNVHAIEGHAYLLLLQEQGVEDGLIPFVVDSDCTRLLI